MLLGAEPFLTKSNSLQLDQHQLFLCQTQRDLIRGCDSTDEYGKIS